MSSNRNILAGYNTEIPTEIMTPDTVETPIGTLDFFDGLPDEATVQKLYDNLIFMRGVEAFLSGIPATSIEAIRLGCVEVGAKRASDIVIFDKLMDSNPLFLTGNTDTVYALAILELDRDGPTVVEIPPKCGPERWMTRGSASWSIWEPPASTGARVQST